MNIFNRAALLIGLLLSFSVFADQRMYEVTVTNITKGMSFTPILAATTHHGFGVVSLGKSASENIERIAEGGDVGPLKDFLIAGDHVLDAKVSEGLLTAGKSTTLKVKMNSKYNHVIVTSMLIPTNDAFFIINVGDIKKRGSSVFMAPAYDAGTEDNSENCANIPGPICKGEGYNAEGGEGFVHIHQGIQNIEDLQGEDYDWNNPVVRIEIKRIVE